MLGLPACGSRMARGADLEKMSRTRFMFEFTTITCSLGKRSASACGFVPRVDDRRLRVVAGDPLPDVARGLIRQSLHPEPSGDLPAPE